jgi:capsule polysaccharide export protein KpsE/RkpR
VRYREQARKALAKASTIVAGKKDGLITVEVEDHDPERAAAIANQYVDELRRLTSTLAVSEAQQRRMFFETQLEDTKRKLTQAQIALQSSGFNPGALKTAPQAAADTYAKARAELAAAEVRLQTLRSSLTDNSPQVLQASANAAALREQVRQLEQSDPDNAKGPDYITKYREFKYQETLFDLLAKQYESAKFDEAREGALIQVVDTAKPPERKVKPQRVIDGVVTGFVAGALYLLYLLMRDRWNAGASDPVEAARRAALRDAFRGQSQRG